MSRLPAATPSACALLSLLGVLLAASACSGWKGGAGDPNGTDGGATDAGAADGGSADGGAMDGGGADGGGADGGGADGGGADGGGADGGAIGDDVDDDGDGWTEDDGDCDDTDDSVHPGAEEICNDGVDDDCNGDSDADWDVDRDSVADCLDLCPVQVDQAFGPGGDGSLAQPLDTVQGGIDAAIARSCAEVEVQPGTYVETIDFLGAELAVRGVGGAEATVLDGAGSGPVVSFQAGEGPGAILEAFTVQGGVAERGAGVYVDAASPTLQDLIVRDNQARGGANLGGGIYLDQSDATVQGCLIRGNSAGPGGADDGNDGGGIAILYGGPLIDSNRVLDNSAGDGGGIWIAHGQARLLHNLIDGNRAQDAGRVDASGYTVAGQGGGIDFQTDTVDVVMQNNLVTNNSADTHGGGIAIIGFYSDTDVSEPTLINNLVAFNSVDSGDYGAGIVVWGISAPVLTNNVLYDNQGVGLYTQYTNLSWTYNAAYSNDGGDYQGALADPAGTDGNLSEHLAFVGVSNDGDWTNDDFHPRKGSALVDAGDPVVLDVDGSRSDMGAYGGPNGSWP